jgi:hypothetical protein
MQWYNVALTNSQVAAQHHMIIQNEFTQLVIPLGAPKDAGLFMTSEPVFTEDPQDRGSWIIYFTPKAASICSNLISRYRGSACEKPDRESVGLFAGYKDCWLLLYDENPSVQ